MQKRSANERVTVIQVLLVHDTSLVRSVLAQWLGREPDLSVVEATWNTVEEGLSSVRPDVCTVDLDCVDGGLPLLGKLSGRGGGAAAPRLLVLADGDRPGLLRQAAEAGARGFVAKRSTPERLVSAIRRVAQGERFVDDLLGFGFLRAAEMPLTRRELSVLSLAADGSSVAEIAGALHLSHGTVRNYLASITRKTGARNRIDAIRISQGEGWL